MGTGIKDALGVEVRVGDTVTVIAYGWNARKDDTGRTTTITGVNRYGTLTHDSEHVANGKPLRGAVVAVARRDGVRGHEGNRKPLVFTPGDLAKRGDCEGLAP